MSRLHVLLLKMKVSSKLTLDFPKEHSKHRSYHFNYFTWSQNGTKLISEAEDTRWDENLFPQNITPLEVVHLGFDCSDIANSRCMLGALTCIIPVVRSMNVWIEHNEFSFFCVRTSPVELWIIHSRSYNSPAHPQYTMLIKTAIPYTIQRTIIMITTRVFKPSQLIHKSWNRSLMKATSQQCQNTVK